MSQTRPTNLAISVEKTLQKQLHVGLLLTLSSTSLPQKGAQSKSLAKLAEGQDYNYIAMYSYINKLPILFI